MTCASGTDGSSPHGSIVYTFRSTLNSIQEWASSPKRGGCGNRDHEPDTYAVVFENGATTATGLFNLNSVEESKTSDDAPFLRALTCSARDLSDALSAARNSFTCPGGSGGSDDISYSSEDDQMRRLASWGTFATLATNESIETNAETVAQLDDDGNPIDQILFEKAKQSREKFRVKKRAVKFAYPPISSMKQCPRPDPDDLENLFFTTDELDLYEHDRRSTGTVDDVEIVAVSTSSSDELPAPPVSPTKGGTPASCTRSSSSLSDWSQKSGLAKFLPSPKHGRKALVEHDESRGRQLQRELKTRRRQTPMRPRTRQEPDENTQVAAAEQEKPKDKRLLKSVQIFLRARSTGNHR
jgi:hypothetical protein